MQWAMLDDRYNVVQFCWQLRNAFPNVVSSCNSDSKHQMNEVVLKKQLLMVNS